MKRMAQSLVLFFCSLLFGSTHLTGQNELERQVVDLEAEDGTRLWALLHTNSTPNPSTGVISVHPRSDRRRDWRLPYFARAGIPGLGMATRHEKSSENQRYEGTLLDLAAGIRYLKNEVGVRRVILVGHSGGGSLITFYTHQSARKPGERFSSTFTGHGPDLNQFDLPPVDLLVISASHFGNAYTFVRKIDPSLTDEEDPTSLNPSLDLYNPANGFREPPESSNFTTDLTFLARYQKAQKERAWRLVRQAQAYIEEKEFYARLMESPGFQDLPLYQRIQITRKAITQRYILIPRLLAVPNFSDLSIDPNDRVTGSNSTPRPDQGNYSRYFHPSFITPESLVSAEAPSSPVHLLKQIKEVTIPTLFISGTADMSEYPSEREAMFKASGAATKDLVWIEGADHGYRPRGPKAGDGKQRDRAAESMIDFIRKAFPGR